MTRPSKAAMPFLFKQMLLVEDNAPLARSLARFFSHPEGAVTVAGSRGEADTLGSTCFDVGIFDLELPDGDGASLATNLLERGTIQRAIFYSGCSDGARVARARLLGPVVNKGSGVQALVAALSEPSSESVLTCDAE